MGGDGGGSRQVFGVISAGDKVLVEEIVGGVEGVGVKLQISEEGLNRLLDGLLHKICKRRGGVQGRKRGWVLGGRGGDSDERCEYNLNLFK